MKRKFLKVFFSFFILAVIVYKLEIDFSFAVLSMQKPTFLIYGMLIPLFITPIIGNTRWKIFLKAQDVNESLLSLIKINFVSLFLGIWLPSSTGFDAFRIYLIEKRNRNAFGAGGASVIVERLMGFYILSLISIIGAFVATHHGLSKKIVFLTIAINVFILSLFIVLKNKKIYSLFMKFSRAEKRGHKLSTFLKQLYGSVNSFSYRKVITTAVPLIILFQTSTVFCGYLVFKAFGINHSFFYHLAFLPLIQIISIVPISFSGLGLREGSFVYFYGLIGTDSSISFIVSLIYYFILMLIPAFIGFIIYFFNNDIYRQNTNRVD